MDDRCYNIFFYINKNVIHSIGIVEYNISGSDEEKLADIKSRVNVDCNRARQFPQIPPLEFARYQAMQRIGNHLALLEPIWQAIDAPADPLMVITNIVDGYPAIMAVSGLGPLNLNEISAQIGDGNQIEDYLQIYIQGGAFNIPKMLNDDYMEAIKLLFNGKKYVSGSKLLMSFIDTMAFVEYGDIQGNFQKWLNAFADLSRLRVTADELWEYRNSVLHTSSPHSRKTISGKVNQLQPYVASLGHDMGNNTLNLWELVNVISAAVQKWLETYSIEPAKMESFIERYDLILSDARFVSIKSQNGDAAVGPGATA